jgi:hypothetical protein
MNELRLDVWPMPSGSTGGECPYPPLSVKTETTQYQDFDPRLPVEEFRHFGWECPWNALPYSIQNGYGRDRNEREFQTAVLENNRLRATFLLEFGGRLWSLFDKKLDRELLFANPVFQPGKLAIRNAWFAGGIEWNLGWPGHHPYTFSPLFAAEVNGPGYPVLRLYEWERKRRTPWQIDFFFPDDDAEFLCSCVRITNPSKETMPVYWWSNLAVPETPHTRTLVPATLAITHGTPPKVVDIPEHDGIDITYPANNPAACDFFFYLEPGVRRWQASVDAEGKGLVYTSNPLLRGRKEFVWGQTPGGRRWQEFLSVPGQAYYEIQSGLGKTQMESIPLPPKTAFCWMEAFGAIDLDPEIAHGDWPRATAAAGTDLDERLPEIRFDTIMQVAANVAAIAPAKLLRHGSGWAALERKRRAGSTLLPAFARSTPYPEETLGPLQQPWLDLLEGRLPADAAILLPAWMIQPEWRGLLEKARETVGDASIWVNYNLALACYDAKEFDRTSDLLAAAPAGVGKVRAAVQRFRAILHRIAGDDRAAIDAYRQALAADPGSEFLLHEACDLFLSGGLAAEYQRLLPGDAASGGGRLRYLAARAALELDDLGAVEAMLARPFEVAEMQEGEASLSELWLQYQTKRLAAQTGAAWNAEFDRKHRREFERSVPPWLDFRMKDYQPR